MTPRDVSRPSPGVFALRLVRGGPLVPAMIVHDHGQWYAWIDGRPSPPYPETADGNCPGDAPEIWRIWHGGRDITAAEYEHMLSVATWARASMPQHPAAKPTERVDLSKLPSLF